MGIVVISATPYVKAKKIHDKETQKFYEKIKAL